MSIKSTFNKFSHQYDYSRHKLIPCFDDFYKITIDIIPFDKENPIKVLDLGAGTGLLSEMIALAYPVSQITLVDISDKMLAIAKTRLHGFKNNIEYREEDYSKNLSQGKYDLIISALSIHHLNQRDKKKLFSKCYTFLNTGGIFINADQALGETPSIEKTYREKWLEDVRNRDVSGQELLSALERMKEDKMSKLSYQLSCLKKAGFSDVTCWYKNYSFVVFSGMKK